MVNILRKNSHNLLQFDIKAFLQKLEILKTTG